MLLAIWYATSFYGMIIDDSLKIENQQQTLYMSLIEEICLIQGDLPGYLGRE